MESDSKETIKEMIYEIVSNGSYSIEVESLLSKELNVLKNPLNIDVIKILKYFAKEELNKECPSIIFDLLIDLEEQSCDTFTDETFIVTCKIKGA